MKATDEPHKEDYRRNLVTHQDADPQWVSRESTASSGVKAKSMTLATTDQRLTSCFTDKVLSSESTMGFNLELMQTIGN
jgi:hypothetical protein